MDSVTELDASTGTLVQILSASSYGFDEPDAVSSDGTDVWVINADDSLTGFPAGTGAAQRAVNARRTRGPSQPRPVPER